MDFLTGLLILIGGMMFLVILLIFIFPPKKKTESNQDHSGINGLEVNTEEYFKVLNFMLMYGVITIEQYNKMEVKGIPFLK